MQFFRNTLNYSEVYLRVYEEIPVVDQTKSLGVTLDKQQTYRPHVSPTRDKCMKRANALENDITRHTGETESHFYSSIMH